MGINYPAIVDARVMHARLIPRRNIFNYGVYYIALPLSRLEDCKIKRDGFSFASFYNKDHGPCDGSSLPIWAKNILAEHGITEADGEITLVCMPRILGYVFNPVSFWICHDKQDNIRAVICEVHNTFGERHSYLCARPDHCPITVNDRLSAEKIFHVSPFLERCGYYEFVFDISPQKLKIEIDYFNEKGKKTLMTSVGGGFSPLDQASLLRSFQRHPLVTLKAITLIHWQALKIILRGIRYIPRPLQKTERISATNNIKKI